MNLRFATRLLLACSLMSAALIHVAVAEDKAPDTVQPVPRDGGWLQRHESFNERAKKGNVDLILIGDSITQGWEGAGKDVWAKYYTKRNAMNLGIGGDRTQHVLWRLDHGNIEGLSPKLAVIMIGTNNSHDNTAEEIAQGIDAIVKKLRAKLPQTKILILAIFPRDPGPSATREKLAKTSDIVAKLADNQTIFYKDIGEKFLSPDKSLSKDIMPDFLHLSPQGYEIWASSIEPEVVQLMGEK